MRRPAIFIALAIFASPVFAQLDPERMLRAAELNDVAFISEALKRGAGVDTSDEHGNTLLMAVAAQGHIELATFLISQRAKINNRNAFGDTPLMAAAHHGKLDMARLLIASGAEVNPEGWTPMHYCAWQNHVDICSLLIDVRARLNVRSPNGTTPLMMAVRQGSTEAVRMLLAHRASTNLENQDGETALSWAIRDRRNEIIRLLKEAGAVETKAPAAKDHGA